MKTKNKMGSLVTLSMVFQVFGNRMRSLVISFDVSDVTSGIL